MAQKEGSDLFFTVGAPVSMKLQGHTVRLSQEPLRPGEVKKLAWSLISEEQQKTFESELELNVAFELRDVDGKRVPAAEVMLKSAYISDLIEKREIDLLKDAIAQGREIGMQTFDQALYDLVKAGRITEEEALEHADSRTNLALKFRLEKGSRLGDDVDLQLKELERDRNHFR